MLLRDTKVFWEMQKASGDKKGVLIVFSDAVTFVMQDDFHPDSCVCNKKKGWTHSVSRLSLQYDVFTQSVCVRKRSINGDNFSMPSMKDVVWSDCVFCFLVMFSVRHT